jgi:hypothetical protein
LLVQLQLKAAAHPVLAVVVAHTQAMAVVTAVQALVLTAVVVLVVTPVLAAMQGLVVQVMPVMAEVAEVLAAINPTPRPGKGMQVAVAVLVC